MSPSSSIAGKAAPVPFKITGDLDIQHAEAVQKLLLIQSDSPALLLDLSGVTACDLTGLQLLLSTRKTASTVGANFSITAHSPAVAAACAGLGLEVEELSHSVL